MDFMVEGAAKGYMVRILSVVEAFTRECLALEADGAMAGRVTRVLERSAMRQGSLVPNTAEVSLVCLRSQDGAIQMQL